MKRFLAALVLATAVLSLGGTAHALSFTLFSSFDTGNADSPAGMSYDPTRNGGTGSLLFTDTGDDDLYEFSRTGAQLNDFDLNPLGDPTTLVGNDLPTGVAPHPTLANRFLIVDQDQDTDAIALGDQPAQRVVDVNSATPSVHQADYSTAAFADLPAGIAKTSGGLYWVTDLDTQTASTVNELFLVDLIGGGAPSLAFDTSGFGLDVPADITIDPNTGNLVVLDPEDKFLYEINALTGALISSFDLQALGITGPRGLAFGPSSDGSGATHLYLTAQVAGQGRVYELGPSAIPEPGSLALLAIGLAGLRPRSRNGTMKKETS